LSVAQPNSSWPLHAERVGAAVAEAGARAASATTRRAARGAERKDRPRYTHRRNVEAVIDVLIWK
jgi:hypothetical protein